MTQTPDPTPLPSFLEWLKQRPEVDATLTQLAHQIATVPNDRLREELRANFSGALLLAQRLAEQHTGPLDSHQVAAANYHYLTELTAHLDHARRERQASVINVTDTDRERGAIVIARRAYDRAVMTNVPVRLIFSPGKEIFVRTDADLKAITAQISALLNN